MRNIKDLSLEELREYLNKGKYENYRVYQILDWVYKKSVKSFDHMTNIPKNLRELLKKEFDLISLEIMDKIESIDGTTKIIYRAKDGEIVESVLIPNREKLTLCISTQIGCKMGCKFCFTGSQGFKRNLTVAEIIDQFLIVVQEFGLKPTNIVMMGMGEPLDNWNNVREALIKLTDQRYCNFSKRRITLSTVGIIPKLRELIDEFPDLPIAISLNAGTGKTRREIMPIEKIYPMDEVLEILKERERSRKIITIEYVVIKGINDSDSEIEGLINLIRKKRIRCKVNLIPFNEWPGSEFCSPDYDRILEIQNKLINNNISTFIRKSKGKDILAACGQLRWCYSNKG